MVTLRKIHDISKIPGYEGSDALGCVPVVGPLARKMRELPSALYLDGVYWIIKWEKLV